MAESFKVYASKAPADGEEILISHFNNILEETVYSNILSVIPIKSKYIFESTCLKFEVPVTSKFNIQVLLSYL